MTIFLPITPPKATAQGNGKRIVVIQGRPRFFKGRQAASAEHALTALLAPRKPHEPAQGPVSLDIQLTWPWRVREPLKTRARRKIPHTSKPDADNSVKSLIDCMTKLGFWKDDSQISDLRIRKWWGSEPGILITIEPGEVA